MLVQYQQSSLPTPMSHSQGPMGMEEKGAFLRPSLGRRPNALSDDRKPMSGETGKSLRPVWQSSISEWLQGVRRMLRGEERASANGVPIWFQH